MPVFRLCLLVLDLDLFAPITICTWVPDPLPQEDHYTRSLVESVTRPLNIHQSSQLDDKLVASSARSH